MHFLKIASLSTMLLGALAAGDACSDGCITNIFNTPASVGCPVVGEAGCICVKPGFREGLQECAVKGCGYKGSLDDLVQPRCGANKLAPESSAASSSNPAPKSTAAPSPTTSSAAPVATTSTSSAVSSSTSQGITQTSSATQSAAASSSAPASVTTSAPAQTSSTDSGSDGGGLSHAAGVGIGVGVAAAVVAAAVVGFCVFRNRKRGQQKAHHSMEISKPLPGSGRTYPADERTSLDKYNNDIEMSSNRYEDMAQGQQPRTMV